MRILFKAQPHSYLPEIKAYRTYLERYSNVKTFDSRELQECQTSDYDVIWHFTGLSRDKDSSFSIHEYNSLSTQPFARSKNSIKKLLNYRPNFRVFLNKTVQDEFNFKDQVPAAIRDMGIDKLFFDQPEKSKPWSYHLVYMGSITRNRSISKVLEHLSKDEKGLKILLIGEPQADLYAQYKKVGNITFTGRVAQNEIPKLAHQAYAGLNFMPDIYPLNIQTSTKLIEYCALGLNVVSTPYKWATNFEQERQASFLWLDKSLSCLNEKNLEQYNYVSPDVRDLEWNKVIEETDLFTKLFNQIGFIEQ